MRRFSLCLTALSVLGLCAVAAQASPIGIPAGTYSLTDVSADGFDLDGTVTIGSNGFATGEDVTFEDSAYGDFTFTGTPSTYTSDNTLDVAELDGSQGQLILYYAQAVSAQGDLVLCTVANPCSNNPDSYIHMYMPTNFQANLSDGTLDPGSSPSATPEPSSLALLGTGILGFAGVMRRRLLRG